MDKKEETSPEIDESRRKFIEKAGKASVAAPAAAILLSGGMQSAQAATADPYDTGGDPIPPI